MLRLLSSALRFTEPAQVTRSLFTSVSTSSPLLRQASGSSSLPPKTHAIFEDPVADKALQNHAAQKIIDDINQEIETNTTGRLFAVIHILGKQFKVTTDDIILLQGYWAPDIGDRIRLEKILLAGSKDFTLLGRPLLPRDLVRIEGTIIEKTFSYNKLHFVLERRKDFRRLKFNKTPYTMVRINSIQFDGLVDEVKDVEGLREKALW